MNNKTRWYWDDYGTDGGKMYVIVDDDGTLIAKGIRSKADALQIVSDHNKGVTK